MADKPKGRRNLMKERNKAQNAVDKNNLFYKTKIRKRNYKLPFFSAGINKLIVEKNGFKMGRREMRNFETIILPNKLEVLLVQDTDPKATHAACCMAVNAGYFSDPPEMPGLAHLLEHMMFLGGNEKYTSGELSRFVNSVGGTENAFTVAEETNYHWSVPYTQAIFDSALDRFTSSFVKPTFTLEGIKNESQVVDNEYSKNVGDPMRCVVELMRANSNPDHPFVKFSCGNYETLHEIPAEKGLDIPDYLQQFFTRHYSANRMKAVLIAPCSIDALKALATKHFSQIENFDSVPIMFGSSPYPQQYNLNRFDMVTNKDDNEILLSFPMENFSNFHKDLPYVYVSTALGNKAPGGLVDYLDEKGWAEGVSAFPMSCANDCVLYWVIISCTEEGIWDHVEDIMEAFFHYISKLYHTGLSDEFIDDVAEKTAKGFANTITKNPYSFGTSLASHMLVTEKSHFLTHGNMSFGFDHDTFLRFCEAIVPEKMTVVISHKGAEAVADMEEERYKAKYTMEKLPTELITRLSTRNPEFNIFVTPKPDIQKELKGFRPYRFVRPVAANVSKLNNLPAQLKENQVLKAKTKVFVYVNEPKVENLDSGKLPGKGADGTTEGKTEEAENQSNGDNADEDDSPPPAPGVGGMMLPTDHFIYTGMEQDELVPLLHQVHDCAEGEDDVGTIGKNKEKKEKGFLQRGVVNAGGHAWPEKNKKKVNLKDDKLKGVNDDMETTNEVAKEEFAFASEEIGKMVELDCTMVFQPPLPDQYRAPLLIKANNKSLLFFKQNIPTSIETLTTQVCVEAQIYPSFLSGFSGTPRERSLLNFYIYFVNSSLSKYRKEMKYEYNIEFSIYTTRNALAISITGYDGKVFDICRQIVDEMKRTQNFKWNRFERYKNALTSGTKEMRQSPMSVCGTLMNFFCSEPRWLYTDMDEAAKSIKLRDCQKFCTSVLQNCNLQVLVMGNATPEQATKMFDLLETSLKGADDNKTVYNPFPSTYRVLMDVGVEAFYIKHTKDIFKGSEYEHKTYHEDNNAGYHCVLQVHKMDYKKQAVLALLSTLIDNPCNDRIRTTERVGYLIYSKASTSGLIGTLEFIFQSNRFGPFSMDKKLETFLVDYVEMLKEYKDIDLLKAMKGLATSSLKPASTVSQEAGKWAAYVAGGGYNFDMVHHVVHELWKVKLEDIIEFYNEYIVPGAPKRRKLVVGVICSKLEEEDNVDKDEKLAQENVELIENPYDFKYSKEMVIRE